MPKIKILLFAIVFMASTTVFAISLKPGTLVPALETIEPFKSRFVLRLTDISVQGLAPIFVAYRDGALIRRGSDNPANFKMRDRLNPARYQGFGEVCSCDGVMLYGLLDHPKYDEIKAGLLLSDLKVSFDKKIAAEAILGLYPADYLHEIANIMVSKFD